MAKIELTVKNTETVEVDVEFPIFRHTWDVLDDGPSWNVFTMILEDGRAYSIEKCTDFRKDTPTTYELTIESKYEFDASGVEYHTGQGRYKSSKEEFYKAVDEMIAATGSVPRI